MVAAGRAAWFELFGGAYKIFSSRRSRPGHQPQQPACLLFSKPIDSLAAAGAILADVWTDVSMPVVDTLGDEFLAAVQTGAKVTVKEDGTVIVD